MGIVPVKSLYQRFKEVKLGNVVRLTGKGPVSSLADMSKETRNSKSANSSGI